MIQNCHGLFFANFYRYGDELPDEMKEFTTTVCIASLVGFMFGGMIGARHAGDKYIAMNHSTKFTSVMQAQVYRNPYLRHYAVFMHPFSVSSTVLRCWDL